MEVWKALTKASASVQTRAPTNLLRREGKVEGVEEEREEGDEEEGVKEGGPALKEKTMMMNLNLNHRLLIP